MFNLPPLNALRTFEAAARCGSFVQAGQELGVSSAAVSLQVKNLEEHLGKKLFVRQGNRIFLTDAGETIYPKLARAFDDISETVQIVRSGRRARQLVISVLPSLSELWLLPRVTGFREHTGVPLDIRVDVDPIDFVGEGVDLRITYGSVFYAGFCEIPLFSDFAIPVCTPAFWDRFSDPEGTLENIPDALLIHNNWGPAFSTEPIWADWMKRARSKPVQFDNPGMIISHISLAIAAARSGAGIALAPYTLVKPDIEAGRLIQPTEISLEMKKNYVCIFPNARAEYPILQLFLDYLSADSKP